MNLSPSLRSAVLLLWDFHRLEHQLTPSDVILVFGSNDLRVAEHAADLYKAGLAPRILFSGARGRMTRDWPETEATAMARVAMAQGVSAGDILIEDRATNTGENIRFSGELLAARGLAPATAIVVQKPYMERRTHAALEVQWPELSCRVSSPPLGFDDYCTEDLPPQLVIEAMTGDFQRILEYPALGFASVQAVPPEVLTAFHELVDGGFGARLR